MPAANPLVEPIYTGGLPVTTNNGSAGAGSPVASVSVGGVHFAIMGIVGLALLGLILLKRMGFAFSVKVG